MVLIQDFCGIRGDLLAVLFRNAQIFKNLRTSNNFKTNILQKAASLWKRAKIQKCRTISNWNYARIAITFAAFQGCMKYFYIILFREGGHCLEIESEKENCKILQLDTFKNRKLLKSFRAVKKWSDSEKIQAHLDVQKNKRQSHDGGGCQEST